LDDDQKRLILMLSRGRETINFFQISSFEAIRQGRVALLCLPAATSLGTTVSTAASFMSLAASNSFNKPSEMGTHFFSPEFQCVYLISTTVLVKLVGRDLKSAMSLLDFFFFVLHGHFFHLGSG
jgi:hypothetical protein